MAMNRNMTAVETEIRDYAQRMMERAEQRENIRFSGEQKECVMEYAVMTGDEYGIRGLVRNLAAAVRSSDNEAAEDILWDARQEIRNFPDTSVGMAELRGYGYVAEDMYPLRRKRALELHRVGEKIYCLYPDSRRGEYASEEMILAHDGLYGIGKETWQHMMEPEEELDNMGELYPPMAELGREEALKMYDAGETVYLITTSVRPAAVRERMEIERGSEYFQMDRDSLERIRGIEQQMKDSPQIGTIKEAKLLLGSENSYGIYQIRDGSPAKEFEYMNMAFIERYGYQVRKEDYELVYSAEPYQGETLESLFEKFNDRHPADYTGHSLSVSDVVVLNENGSVKAYFVDSVSFRELTDFLHLELEKDEGLDNPERISVDYDELQKKAKAAEAETMQKATGEYKPLAKVEELEEANYNMIDNVLNNMPPKKKPYLEFYAAECDEFHHMANFYKSENLEEMLRKYREILDDPSLSYFGNGMGIIYRDSDDTVNDGAEVSLVTGKSIHGNHLDDVAFLVSLPMARDALEKIVEAFPDFRYYPPKEIEVHYYPERMTADELAAALNELTGDFDRYDYRDNFNPEEDIVETVALELRCGNAHKYIPFLKDVVDEECEQSRKAEELLAKLKIYQPEVTGQKEPLVKVNFCEDKELQLHGYRSIDELDRLVSEKDAGLASKTDPETGEPENTAQMFFTIYYLEDGRMNQLRGKINIGDGNGGIVSHLKNQTEMQLADESWLDYQKAKGEESFQAYVADLTDMREHVLPYLQRFCSLEEKTPEKQQEIVCTAIKQREDGKGKNGRYGEKEMSSSDRRKTSLHERLAMNKCIIAQKQGKECEEKGDCLVEADLRCLK